MPEVVIDKLVHGGQGIGTLEDGRKVFVWNALPGEKVEVDVRKSKNKYLEGIASNIIEPSKERIEPRDEAYLSTSPWQMMTFDAENKYKKSILEETFSREHVDCPSDIPFHNGTEQWHYRNKMEYSFWGDDDGLHLALFHRASHGKRIITGSSIAMQIIDRAANNICQILNAQKVRGSDLKTVIVRANQKGEAVAAIFVKTKDFPELKALSGICRGVAVYYSNPKSPASVVTEELYTYGDITLKEVILGTDITYDVNSFFQVNLPVFSATAYVINKFLLKDAKKVDMYAGVGTLALLTGATKMVEIDEHNVAMAKQNANGKKLKVVLASSERATEHITADASIIVDPPRAGLHTAVTDRIREVKPPKIAYLSCNPITQARDIALIQDLYELEYLEGFNFFPRTPHIESLALLKLRDK